MVEMRCGFVGARRPSCGMKAVVCTQLTCHACDWTASLLFVMLYHSQRLKNRILLPLLTP